MIFRNLGIIECFTFIAQHANIITDHNLRNEREKDVLSNLELLVTDVTFLHDVLHKPVQYYYRHLKFTYLTLLLTITPTACGVTL